MHTPDPDKRQIPSHPHHFLSTFKVFQCLPPAVLRELEGRLDQKTFTSKESIYLTGDPALYVWFVKEGHVQATVDMPNGRRQTLCMVGPGQMFGTCCCFGGGAHPCNASAVSEVTTVRMPTTEFTALMERYPAMTVALVAEISNRLRASKDTQSFDQESVKKRICRALLELVKDFGNVIPLTRRTLAEMVGTTTETSIRTFGELELAGFVTTGRNRITVTNTASLAACLDSE